MYCPFPVLIHVLPKTTLGSGITYPPVLGLKKSHAQLTKNWATGLQQPSISGHAAIIHVLRDSIISSHSFPCISRINLVFYPIVAQ